jgi:uncharacterized membrane protein
MKKVRQSKVVWLNMAIFIIALFDVAFFKTLGISDDKTAIIVSLLTKVTAITNIILRVYFTYTPIENPFNNNKDE